MIEIIPAIDIMGGKCVRLTQGDYDRQTTYFEDPLDAALMFRDAGLRRLHMVDLDGAKESGPRNLATLGKVFSKSGMAIQFGGGIKNEQALHNVFSAGAFAAICGSVAADRPETFRQWLLRYGAEKLILGADIKNGRVATHGWLEDSGLGITELLEAFITSGLKKVICTDISRDGTLSGPDMGLYEDLMVEFPSLEITVSGGISSMQDIYALEKGGMHSVILGKAFYEGKVTLDDLKNFTGC